MPVIRNQPQTPACLPDGLKSELVQSVLRRQLEQTAPNLTDVILQSTKSILSIRSMSEEDRKVSMLRHCFLMYVSPLMHAAMGARLMAVAVHQLEMQRYVDWNADVLADTCIVQDTISCMRCKSNV